MTDGPTTPPPSGLPGRQKSLIDRAKDIVVTPKTEWPVIDAEPATVGGIYTSYVMILAAIPPVALTIGLLLFMPQAANEVQAYTRALGLPTITTTSIIVGGVVQYLMALASVYIIGMIIDALAPTFGSTKDPLKAFKVAAYYPTAAWLAGALLLIPGIGMIVMLVGAIYSLYLLYVGLPILMKTPADKQVGYFVAVLVVAIVVLGIVNVITNRIIYGGMF
jgi:hypothetical protein